jgi:two-component system chemotaxis response regulator CheY
MHKVMVVDDTQFIRIRIARLLIENGYKVIEATDGLMAVDSYRSDKPDAVLMDITMEGKDGLTALAEIRDFDPQAKVIMVTALSQEAIILRAMQLGAKDFLVKPYEPERVLKTLQKVLGE